MGQVLLVDDETTVRVTLAAYLEDDGFDVVQAESAEDAIQALEGGCQPAVCIMDMRLPGMDGHDAIVALHARLPQLLFLIHTGSLSYSLTEDLRAIGVNDTVVFHKPLQDMGILADTVREMLAPGGDGHA